MGAEGSPSIRRLPALLLLGRDNADSSGGEHPRLPPEGGRIDVGARLDDHVAEVSVADTGIGIAPADQETVFEEFRQVGAADKKAEGTGLGLALSRKFIELHGGRIWVKSQVGQGSTFTFTLPGAS